MKAARAFLSDASAHEKGAQLSPRPSRDNVIVAY